MDDLKSQMQGHFIQYASYVILDRAIPNVVDGLKPGELIATDGAIFLSNMLAIGQAGG